MSTAPDTTIHVILADFGKHGQAIVERDANATDLESTVRDLLSGQIDHPIRVYAFNPMEGWANDVSEDIAHEIAARREHLSPALIDFVEVHAGILLANSVRAA